MGSQHKARPYDSSILVVIHPHFRTQSIASVSHHMYFHPKDHMCCTMLMHFPQDFKMRKHASHSTLSYIAECTCWSILFACVCALGDGESGRRRIGVCRVQTTVGEKRKPTSVHANTVWNVIFIHSTIFRYFWTPVFGHPPPPPMKPPTLWFSPVDHMICVLLCRVVMHFKHCVSVVFLSFRYSSKRLERFGRYYCVNSDVPNPWWFALYDNTSC
jgi:hypothetical protein